jgi:hypothetical protein
MASAPVDIAKIIPPAVVTNSDKLPARLPILMVVARPLIFMTVTVCAVLIPTKQIAKQVVGIGILQIIRVPLPNQ